MTKKQKKTRNRIIIVLILFTALLILNWTGALDGIPWWGKALACLVPYLIIGYDIILKAAKNIRNGQVFDENFLMMVATFGAFGIGEYFEALAVMLFYQIGELFQGVAVGKSRQSITEMMSIVPEYANVEKDGEIEETDPEDVEIGDILVVRAGEKIPLDGVVIEGNSFLDTAALTGESVPRRASVGDTVISGCVNGEGVLRIRAEKRYEDSTVSRILELVENASNKKARLENFITRFARWYTPIVTIGAALLALVPPLVLGGGFANWIHRACIFLIVSCPCALVISVPLGFFGGIGAASKIGVLVKGSNYLEAIAEMTSIVFDKTGTLTHGQFAVDAVHPEVIDKRELLHLAAHVEHFSTHPIGAALRNAFPEEATDGCRITDVEEIAGHGIRAQVGSQTVWVGNTKLMDSIGASWHDCTTHRGTIIHVAIDGKYAGHIVINDQIKEDSLTAIQQLKALGVSKTVMLTGDRREVAADVAEKLGLTEYHAELLPTDKVAKVEQLLTERSNMQEAPLAFVGDGINDAPVLARADVGIAMGGLGSDAAIEAADVVLMDDQPSKIALAIRIARQTLDIARQNVTLAIGIKAAVLVLAAVGIATMWMAVFADVGVTVLAVLNAMRALRIS